MGKSAPLCLNGSFILSQFVLGPYIATAEPGNYPREPFSLPLHEGAQSRAVESGNQSAGALALPTFPHPKSAPFSK